MQVSDPRWQLLILHWRTKVLNVLYRYISETKIDAKKMAQNILLVR